MTDTIREYDVEVLISEKGAQRLAICTERAYSVMDAMQQAIANVIGSAYPNKVEVLSVYRVGPSAKAMQEIAKALDGEIAKALSGFGQKQRAV